MNNITDREDKFLEKLGITPGPWIAFMNENGDGIITKKEEKCFITLWCNLCKDGKCNHFGRKDFDLMSKSIEMFLRVFKNAFQFKFYADCHKN